MIKHILKDSTTLKSIEGHKIKKADAPLLYEYLKERRKGNGDHIQHDKRGK